MSYYGSWYAAQIEKNRWISKTRTYVYNANAILQILEVRRVEVQQATKVSIANKQQRFIWNAYEQKYVFKFYRQHS